jgi:hypothetical protein
VNPLAVTLPTTVPLEISQLPRFKASVEPLRAQIQLAKESTVIAAID